MKERERERYEVYVGQKQAYMKIITRPKDQLSPFWGKGQKAALTGQHWGLGKFWNLALLV